MRYVEKGPEPKELTQFRASILSTPGVGAVPYDEMTAETKSAIMRQCLAEQGYLCAYTGLRIEAGTSHLEHMYPRSQGEARESLAYWNLVACYPGPGEKNPGFGALLKANWPTVEERSIFVRPTDESCENRFAYDREGTIQPKDPGDAAAKTTIQALNLCHEDLKRYRNEAWQETTDEFSSLAALRHRLSGLDEPSNGRLEPLCFVKKHALQRKLEKLRQFR